MKLIHNKFHIYALKNLTGLNLIGKEDFITIKN